MNFTISKLRIITGVFAVSILIILTLFLSRSMENINDHNLQINDSKTISLESPKTCTPFVILAKIDTKIECIGGFIEILEKEDGNTLVMCSCEDPLRCANEERERQK